MERRDGGESEIREKPCTANGYKMAVGSRVGVRNGGFQVGRVYSRIASVGRAVGLSP